ncbi:MAG: hypothetical protein HWQ58_09700 [Nostoc sp. LPT]|uniref:hypothetical protein n=1 Tax=uncultured Nostoc sp. TaxID=340711 RepID=UPI001D6369F9|nr:hypothetical protein [Nostoc sp. LPT]
MPSLEAVCHVQKHQEETRVSSWCLVDDYNSSVWLRFLGGLANLTAKWALLLLLKMSKWY